MVYTCLYHLKLWFLGDCLWHWVSHISNHLHMVQGRTEDDYTPDETPKTPKTPKSARSPNNRINLPKEFPMLGWQNRQSLDFGVAKWFYCWIWSLLGKSVCVCVAVIWCWNMLAVPQFTRMRDVQNSARGHRCAKWNLKKREKEERMQ